MGFESFYGGRQGASFVIVKRFDGLNAPQGSQGEAEVVYRNKEYAVTSNQEYFLYEVEQGEEHLIEKNSENYKTYTWKIQDLDGSEVSAVPASDPSGEVKDIQLSEEKAEYMVPCFIKGGDTVDQVNYGEYVIIDTIFGLHERSNPDNGKVYRRGMNFNGELGGAEYIGQIVGPRGETTEVDLSSYTSVLEEQGAAEGQWDVSDGLVPGKYIDETTGELAFNDDIKYSWVNIRDSYGNVESVLIGFQFPYLVQDFVAESISPYDNEGDPLPANTNLVDRIDKGDHPFYEKWKISIPKGIKGDTISNLRLYNVTKAGTKLYDNNTWTGTPEVSVVDYPIVETIANYYKVLIGKDSEEQDIFKYATPTENTTKVGKRIGYDNTNYDTKEAGVVTFVDIGSYNDIDSVEFNSDPDPENPNSYVLTIHYTYNEDEKITLPLIDDVKINTNDPQEEGSPKQEGNGDQRLYFHFKTRDAEEWTGVGDPINYIIDTYIVPIDDPIVKYRGHLLVYYSNPDKRIGLDDDIEYPCHLYNDEGELISVSTNAWTDLGYVKGEEGGVRVFAEYESLDSLYRQPLGETGNRDNPIPPEYLGIPEGGDPNLDHAGWIVSIVDTRTNKETLYAYDYFATNPGGQVDGNWFQLGSIETTTDPRKYLALYTGSGSGEIDDRSYLETKGFAADATVTRSVLGTDNKVITQLSQKTGPNVYTDYKVGPELEYIGAYNNSNNNNLEEQLFIGYDKEVTVSVEPDTPISGSDRITRITRFKTTSGASNYYILTEVFVVNSNTYFINDDYDIVPKIGINSNTLVINLNAGITSREKKLTYFDGTNDINISQVTRTATSGVGYTGYNEAIGAIV